MSTPLRLEGVANIRDLGGLATADGSVIRRGRVFRSASLHEMTQIDRETLQRLGVRVVADLRSDWERARHPYDLGFARVVHAPLADAGRAQDITRRFMEGTMTSAELEGWWDLTGMFDAPEEHVAAIRTVFGELLALPEGEAILYHCTGGKDRTGLITALLLEGLGVDRATVAEDFLRSDMMAETHLDTAESRQMRRAIEAMDLSPAALRAITTVDPEWLDRLMAGIETRHGSVRAYLADYVGIGEDGVERLRASYLEEGARPQREK